MEIEIQQSASIAIHFSSKMLLISQLATEISHDTLNK